MAQNGKTDRNKTEYEVGKFFMVFAPSRMMARKIPALCVKKDVAAHEIVFLCLVLLADSAWSGKVEKREYKYNLLSENGFELASPQDAKLLGCISGSWEVADKPPKWDCPSEIEKEWNRDNPRYEQIWLDELSNFDMSEGKAVANGH